jgi:hypothetical protein
VTNSKNCSTSNPRECADTCLTPRRHYAKSVKPAGFNVVTYGKLIGEALLYPEKREAIMRQVTCKSAASQQITCHCGAILDEKTVSVLESKPANSETITTIVVCCSDCRAKCHNTVRRLVASKAEPGELFTWLTWLTSETVQGLETLPEVSTVPGLNIVRQNDVIRGPGKYRIVHSKSDCFLSQHSSKRKAKQCLAELQGLADWTKSATSVKKQFASKASREALNVICKSYE